METFRLLAFKIITNKRYILLFVILTICNIGVCQSHKVDSIDYYIRKLDWKSFGITTNYVAKPYLLNDANKIISIKDKAKVRKLIQFIKVDSKTVAIHMILTKLLEPNKAEFKQSYIYGSNSTVTGVNYIFNGLSWKKEEKSGYSILKKDISNVKKYWLTRPAKVSLGRDNESL